MNVYPKIFSSESMSNSDYVMVLLAFWNKVHSNLREKQSKCLNKIKWGEPVLTGKHALSTLDRKQRGGKNILNSEGNTLSGDEEDQSKDQLTCEKEVVSDAATAINVNITDDDDKKSGLHSNKYVLRLPKLKIKVSDTHNKEPDKTIESHNKEPESIENKKITRLSLKRLGSKKQVNKENVNRESHPNLVLRRRLFKNNESVSETSTNWTSIKSHQLNDTPKIEPLYSKLGLETSGTSEIVCDIGNSTRIKKTTIKISSTNEPSASIKISSTNESSALSPVELAESPKRDLQKCQILNRFVEEENSSSNEEVPSSSPVFLSKDRDNSEMVQNDKKQNRDIGRGAKNRRKKPRTKFKNSSEKPEITDECDAKDVIRILPHVTDESNKDDEVLTNLQKRKHNLPEKDIKSSKKMKLSQKKPTVQCPLCCDWFKPNVIESHAANCGTFTRRELRTTTSVSQQPLPENEPNTDITFGCDANCKLLSEISENSADKSTDARAPPVVLVDHSTSNTFVSDVKQTENLQFAKKLFYKSEVNTFPVSATLDKKDQHCEVLGDRLKTVEPVRDLPINSDNSHLTIQSAALDSITEGLPVEDISEEPLNNTHSTKVSTEHWKTDTEQKDINLTTKEKRCYICDATYADDTLYKMHLKSCWEKYKKLKQQFENKFNSKQSHRKTRRQSKTKCHVPGSDAENKQAV